MTSLDPETIAAIFAAIAGVLVYFSDRLTEFWRRITARSRWVAVILRLHPPTAVILRGLRGSEDRWMGILSTPTYGVSPAFFLIPSIIPGTSQFDFDLSLLYAYSFAVLGVVHGWLAHRVPLELAKADSKVDGMPRAASWRYGLSRDFAVAWAPGLVGALAGQVARGGIGIDFSTGSRLFSLGLLVYLSYLIYSQWWDGSRKSEDLAYQRWIVEKGKAPQIEIWLERRMHKESQQVTGTLLGLGRAMRLQRTDSFIEELEWHEVRRIAIKP